MGYGHYGGSERETVQDCFAIVVGVYNLSLTMDIFGLC